MVVSGPYHGLMDGNGFEKWIEKRRPLSVEWGFDCQAAALEHVGIDHGGLYVFVVEKLFILVGLGQFVVFQQGQLYNAVYNLLYSRSLYNTPHGGILQRESV
jgi:hypothetical protein